MGNLQGVGAFVDFDDLVGLLFDEENVFAVVRSIGRHQVGSIDESRRAGVSLLQGVEDFDSDGRRVVDGVAELAIWRTPRLGASCLRSVLNSAPTRTSNVGKGPRGYLRGGFF